jgi:hypothetical protein
MGSNAIREAIDSFLAQYFVSLWPLGQSQEASKNDDTQPLAFDAALWTPDVLLTCYRLC